MACRRPSGAPEGSLMSSRQYVVVLAAAVAVALASSVGGSAQVASNTEREEFTAIATNLGSVGATGITRLDLVVERWSTEAERDRLMEAFRKQGPEAALRVLQNMPRVGYMRTPETLAYDLRYAYQTKGEDGGRRIILATDRPIGFWEARQRPRSIDYPFTLIEMRIGEDGEGEGKMSIAARITAAPRSGLVLEDYSTHPVMLTEIRQRGQ